MVLSGGRGRCTTAGFLSFTSLLADAWSESRAAISASTCCSCVCN